ncbi:MAG: RimK family alpha-L-glutamate ligase, partial [Candidatus Nanohaloarchaea archaeon]
KEMFDKYSKILLKPRYDFGGRGIEVYSDIEDVDRFDKGDENLLVQRFIDSSKGIPEMDIEGLHDLRIIFVSDEPVLSYVRQPKNGYISNENLGGSINYVEIEDIPEKAFEVTEVVKDCFDEYKPNLYTVDLIFDNGGEAHILELNSKPGTGFHSEETRKDYEYPLMVRIVEALKEL